MGKAKISAKKAQTKKKLHFLPPSSPYRLPIPLLTLFSLGFFLFLIGIIMMLSFQDPLTKFAFSPVDTTKNINLYGNDLVKQAKASDADTAYPMPMPLGYCLNVPILMYHHVQPMLEATKLGHAQLTVDRDIFEKQLAYLAARDYTTITLDSLIDALQKKAPVPEKSIVLTFDDGYIDMYTYVFPLLKQYDMVGNFMISTGLVNNTDYMTWEQVKELSEHPLISLYNHTWSHNGLGYSTKERIDFELEMSKQDFISHIGFMSNVFAYPYGSYSDLAIARLQDHGFTAAVTTEPGRIQCDSYLMKLKRDHVGNALLSTYGL